MYIYLGSGLGLFLCKTLCELMGGNIDVQSIYGEGTKFTCYVKEHNMEENISYHMGSVEEGSLELNSLPSVHIMYIYIYIYRW